MAGLTAVFLASACDFLLGPDPTEVDRFSANWEKEVVTTGTVSGLDIALGDQGDLLVSYVYEESNVRVSRYTGNRWDHLDGPSVTGSGTIANTHIATDPAGQALLMYYSGSDMEIIPIGASFGTSLPLSTLESTRRDTVYSRPPSWDHESAGLEYGADGRIRVLVKGSSDERLWLFRQEDTSWSLGIVPFSQYVHGKAEMAISQNNHEHIVFQANSQGFYVWWRENEGWAERLKIPDSQPYILRLRSDELSVLATRHLNQIHIAEEIYDPVAGGSFWLIRTAVEDELLFWANMDLVVDENGFPHLVYILFQDWDKQYQVWYTSLESDGSWASSLIAGNLRTPYFSPFNLRLVREESGRAHIFLTTGAVSGVSGVNQEHAYQLMHLYSDNPHGIEE